MHFSSHLVVASVLGVVALCAGLVVRLVLRRRGRRALAEDLHRLRAPIALVTAAAFVRVAVDATTLGPWAPLVDLTMVVGVAWGVVRGLGVVESALFRQLAIDVVDNVRARSRRTQIGLLKRVVVLVVVVSAALVALFALTPARELGPSLLAYASLVGVVLGLALRDPLESLVAGISVAVTEPIRIDDVVVVEDEWGRVEQLGLANVVVRLWDDRRLILPTKYFLDEPFENWTRHSAEVTGTVMIPTDFTTDVHELRGVVERIVQSSPLWDRRSWALQVVDATPDGMQLRCVVTARNASDLFDLRCDVREQVIAHLARTPKTLPTRRAHAEFAATNSG